MSLLCKLLGHKSRPGLTTHTASVFVKPDGDDVWQILKEEVHLKVCKRCGGLMTPFKFKIEGGASYSSPVLESKR